MGKIRLYFITAKVIQYPTKSNRDIIILKEMEKKPIKGKGPKPPVPPRPKVWEAIDELRGAMGEILTEMRSGFKTVFQFIEEQKVINAEVKGFMAEQKEFNTEVKGFMVEQKEFNKKIENRLDNLVKKNKLKE